MTLASTACIIYSTPAIHITNTNGATDYAWLPNRLTGGMTEGIAWNVTDQNGFMNTSTQDRDMDILIMGSSHMEGNNVFLHQSTVTLLQEYSGLSVYNIATSGHTLLHCVKNLPNALEVMAPQSYVVIETGSTQIRAKDIEACLNGEMDSIPSHGTGLLRALQEIKYLRLAVSQLEGLQDRTAETKNNAGGGTAQSASVNEQLYSDAAFNSMLSYISSTCEAYGVKPIILYHPPLVLNKDGTASAELDEETLDMLRYACESNGVLFIDMTDDFLELYRQNYVLPHGFCNSHVGAGHLNASGHKAIAERLVLEIGTDSHEEVEEQ